MKKIFIAVFMCTFLIFVASPGGAVPIVNPPTGWTYGSPVDTILGFEYLHEANETQELIFANTVLASYGMGTTELLNGTGEKVNIPGDAKSIAWDPGFAWVYAAVKVDGPNDYTYLFWDNQAAGGDDILTTPAARTLPFNGPELGISHITFFGPSQVPEPTTMLLLGFGLVGFTILRKRF